MSLSDHFSILQSAAGLPVINYNGSRKSRSRTRTNISSAVRQQKAFNRLNRGDQHRSRSKVRAKNLQDQLLSGPRNRSNSGNSLKNFRGRSQSRHRKPHEKQVNISPSNPNKQGGGVTVTNPISTRLGRIWSKVAGDQRKACAVGMAQGRIQKMTPISNQ